jgi:hypothetical protein
LRPRTNEGLLFLNFYSNQMSRETDGGRASSLERWDGLGSLTNLRSTRRRHGMGCAVLSISDKDRSPRAPGECATGVVNSLDENQRRRFHCVRLSWCARGKERSVPPKSPLIVRYQVIYTLIAPANFAAKFIRDVDHHARACWWSTSESSEKCPRVMRGNMSVPSEYAFSSYLIWIWAEFVVALLHCVDAALFLLSSQGDERN